MRYYEISLFAPPSTPSSSLPAVGSTSGGLTVIATTVVNSPPPTFPSWSSHPNGIRDPGALNVEFDFMTLTGGSPGMATLRIEGVGLDLLKQAKVFAPSARYPKGLQIVVKGGMKPGLPLASVHPGVIWNGYVNQSFGNWIGADMTLDFVMSAGPFYSVSQPGNFMLVWPPGTTLQAALTNCLKNAMPGYNPIFGISAANQAKYVLSHDGSHMCSTFQMLASYINSITIPISNPNPGPGPGQGVYMAINANGTVHIWDGSLPNTPVPIAFTDLIGQPTWIGPGEVSFMTQMRADILSGTVVQMPTGPGGIGLGATGTVIVAPGNTGIQFGPQYETAFQGQIYVQSVRHIGNFRDSQGSSWATVFTGYPVPPPTTSSTQGVTEQSQ